MEIGADATLGEVFLEAGYRQRVAPGQGAPPPHRAPPAGHRFGAWLRAALRCRGITARRLADHLGVTEAMVSRWLRGTAHPRVTKYGRIAEVLGLEVAVVLEQAGYRVLPSPPAPQAEDEGAGMATSDAPGQP